MVMTVLVGLAVALVVYNAVIFAKTSGSLADRLSATWKGSMTIFVGVWGAIASLLTVGLDGLAQLTGDPMFGQWSEAVKGVIPPQWHPYVPLAGMTAMLLARLRTVGK